MKTRLLALISPILALGTIGAIGALAVGFDSSGSQSGSSPVFSGAYRFVASSASNTAATVAACEMPAPEPAPVHDENYGRRRPAPIRAIESGAANVRVEILVGGEPAILYRDGAYHWLEGQRGERFSYRVTNRNPYPVGIILSADGQSLTADGPAKSSHPAYVIDPYGSETISVWREDLRGGRELVFTDVDRSLAARKGDRRNIGVLGVLVWQLQDKTPPPPRPVPVTPGSRDDGRESSKAGGAPQQPSPSGAARDRAANEADPGIGVGTGDRVEDQAYMTDRFRRVRVLGSISIYYDDYQGLRRAGIDLNQYDQPYPRDRRRSDPFPDGGYQGVKIP